MDLAEASGQPMIDTTLGLSLVFNGAIYNYPELRKELAALGYRFGRHRVSLSAMILLDRYYVSFNSDTVAATDPTRFFAGRGRTFTLGVTSEF